MEFMIKSVIDTEIAVRAMENVTITPSKDTGEGLGPRHPYLIGLTERYMRLDLGSARRDWLVSRKLDVYQPRENR